MPSACRFRKRNLEGQAKFDIEAKRTTGDWWNNGDPDQEYEGDVKYKNTNAIKKDYGLRA